MSKRVLTALVALTGIGAVALAGSLAAQEKDTERVARSYVVRAGGSGGYLGISIGEVTAETVEELGLRAERGVWIQDVGEDTPASRAGLLKDDVIVTWNGTAVEGTVQLQRFLRETPAGRTITVAVIRNGNQRNVSVEVGERESFGGAWSQSDMARELGERVRSSVRAIPHIRGFQFMTRGGRMGASVQSLDGQLAEYFGLRDGRGGVLINSIGDDTPSEKAGLKAGDVILSVDGTDVADPGDLISAILEADEGPVSLRILRDKKERTVTVELPELDHEWKSDDGEAHGFYFDSEDGHEPHVEFFGPDDSAGDVRIRVAPSIPQILELYQGTGSVNVSPGGQIRIRVAPEAPKAEAQATVRPVAPSVAL